MDEKQVNGKIMADYGAPFANVVHLPQNMPCTKWI